MGVKADEEKRDVYNAVLEDSKMLEEINPEYNSSEKEDEESK